MKSVLLLTTIFMILLKISNAQNNVLVADHSVVDKYVNIPEEYINAVKTMFLSYPGESHSRGLMYGLEDLEEIDSRFSVNVTWVGEPESPTSNYLRACKTFRNLSNTSWSSSGGEEDFFTSDEAVNMMLNHLDYCSNSMNNSVSALGFGWCWDMTWKASPDEDGWGGRLLWPVNESNYTDHWDTTTTSPCMQDYIDAVNIYNSNSSGCITFFSTGPVDGGGNEGASGYQRWLKNEFIRDSAKKKSGTSYVFDYADILCWNDDGEKNTTFYDGHEFIYIHPDNVGNYDGGQGGCHISREGCLRLAKAMWWLLASMKGWDDPSISSLDATGSGKIVKIYSLKQNFPNPFNPTTVIRWEQPQDSQVNLSIFNILGENVSTLVSQKLHAGQHQVEWDASGFAGGVYFYQIEFEEYMAVKKMILLK